MPQRGIHEGDPLSPYICVLCMEKLSQIIEGMVHESIWKPIQANKRGPLISHLLFDDDVLLFGTAIVKEAKCMMES